MSKSESGTDCEKSVKITAADSFVNPAGDMTKKESRFDSLVNKEPKKIPRMSKIMLTAAVMATVGHSMVAGYNLGVVNVPEAVLKNFCNESLRNQNIVLDEKFLDLLWSFVVSANLFGAMIGSLGACFLANFFGRKPALFFNSVLGLAAAGLFGFSNFLGSVEMLIVGRVVVGLFSGATSTLVPMYLMEVSPTHLKGAMGALLQLGLTTGVLVSQILGQEEILGTDERWPILLSAYAVFVLFGLLLLSFCPESPPYLYLKRKDEAATIKALEKMSGAPIEDIMDSLMLLKREQKINESAPEWSMMQILKAKELRIPLLLVIAMQAGQQLSGISNIFYYSTSTFEKTGMSIKNSQYGSMGTGVMNVIMSIVAVPLVNSNNRRRLLQISIPGMIVCLTGFTICSNIQHLGSWIPYVMITFFICIVGTYGIGLGPLPFMIGSELFQQGPRAAAMGIGCLANWFSNCLMAMTFPILQDLIGEYVFLMYVGFVFTLGVFLHFYFPETKGLEPVEVAAIFRAKTVHHVAVNERERQEFIISSV